MTPPMTATARANELLEALRTKRECDHDIHREGCVPCDVLWQVIVPARGEMHRLGFKNPDTLRVAIALAEYAGLAEIGAGCIGEFCNRLDDERTGYTSIKTFREVLAALRNEAKSQSTNARTALAAWEKLFPEAPRA